MSEQVDWTTSFIAATGAFGVAGRSPQHRDLGDGLFIPAMFTATFIEPEARITATIEVAVSPQGHAQCRGLEVRAQPGAPGLTTDAVRLPISTMVDRAVRRASRKTSLDEDNQLVLVMADEEAASAAAERVRTAKPPSQRRPRIGDDQLKLVAEAYRSDPARPTRAVAAQLVVSMATAGRYVKKAREAGYLGPAAGKGKKGER